MKQEKISHRVSYIFCFIWANMHHEKSSGAGKKLDGLEPRPFAKFPPLSRSRKSVDRELILKEVLSTRPLFTSTFFLNFLFPCLGRVKVIFRIISTVLFLKDK